ncbi:hypothetical protein [Pseudomonas sp. 1 R 17]|uniref:hypothetical protein n=1 Tax=Pseudomonas sp. 1 R 17 TaxID=1844091 RepID=UPI000812B255|nr:hypothetical protein [Pseudomonas sp. 1 R 17]SAM32902.1 hypothetical protein BN1864_LIB5394:02949 [Pseudomonas sp. 1 R 17]
MPLYTEEDRAKARHICNAEISHIREASTPGQVNERGWLALGYIQGIYELEAVSVAEHCQLIKDLADAEVQRLADLKAISGR